MTYLLISIAAFQLGTILGFSALYFLKYKPLLKREREARAAAKKALLMAKLMMTLDRIEKARSKKNGLILSPFQVKRYGEE